MSVLLVHVVAVAQSTRVETGVQLRMTDALNSRQPAAPETAVRAASVATEPVDAAKPTGPRFRGLSLRLTSGLRFDDNALNSAQDPQRDVIVVMKPAAYLDARLGRHDVRVGYEGEVERFQGISSENRLNHKFLASGNLDLSRRLKSKFESALEYGTDSRGDVGTRQLVSGEPDRWRAHSVGGDMTLGRRIAQAQVGAGFDLRGLRYLNNDQQVRDFDERTLTLSGRYNLGPRYSLVADVSSAWIDYLNPATTLDAREYTALIGLEWEATAKTNGSIRVGRRYRDFYEPGRSGSSGLTWDARVNWAPKTYSQFTAYSSRSVSEGGLSGLGGGSSVTLSDTLGLRWRHGFTARTTFEAGIERSVSGSDGSDGDEFMTYGAGVRYRLNRWVDVFTDWKYRSRSSDSPGVGFDTGSVFIGFEARLDHAFER